jgi:hypothetical protein
MPCTAKTARDNAKLAQREGKHERTLKITQKYVKP